MNLSLYSAATGMEAQQLNLNTIANNLANVNKPGFKRSKIGFQDLPYQKPRASAADSGGKPRGAIRGDGFFEVQRPDGTLGFPRDGSFKLNAQGQVVTIDGLP